MDIERLKRYIDIHGKSIKVVSFDVFDTLLIRLVPSERVSQISANNLRNLLNKNEINKLSVEEILKSRNDFIHRQMEISPFKEKEWLISGWLKSVAQEKDLDPDLLINLGRRAELDAEEVSLRAARNAYKAVESVKGQGLLAVAISDMWLDQEWLKELLIRFGLIFDGVFTSGTSGYSKKRRTIFKEIERHYKLPGEAFLHIGNKLRVDCIYPRLSGWNSLWFPMRHPLARMNLPFKFRVGPLKHKSFEDIIQAFEMPLALKERDPYYRLAYDYLAPLLIIFSIVQWRIFRRQGIEIAYYIARDSYMMKEVYDIISDMLPGSCQRQYIHLSRRAVALAHPDDLLQNAIPLAGKVGRKTLGDWLSNFTINPDLRDSILRESGLNEQSDLNESAKSDIRIACLSHLKEIQELQEKLRTNIHDYLLQQGGRDGIERIGIVDSGWACTTQDSIRAALNNPHFISGVYLGVSLQGNKPSSSNNKYGLLRDDFRRPEHHNPIESSAGVVRAWDTLLREPIDTVSAIQRLPDDKVIPIFSDTTAIRDRERLAARSILEGVQQGATARLKGVSLIARLDDYFTDADFEMVATAIAQRITTCPDRKTASAIISLGFDEGTAGGKSGSLGLNGIKDGVCWYPGILGKLGLRWASPLLKMVGGIILNRSKLEGKHQ